MEGGGAMAEVGLLPFARIALQVSRAVLPSLPKPFQQAPIHPAAVAGHPLSDALRRLDLSRSRGASERASRIAPGIGAWKRARLHDAVSLLAASRRPDHRPRGRRNGSSVARFAAPGAEAGSRLRGCNGFGAGSGEHVLCTAPASSRAKTTALGGTG